MRHFILVAVFLLCGLISSAQSDLKQSLVVVHVDPAGGTQFKQQIVVYHFLNGSFTGRDEVMTVTGRKEGKDYIRTDLGQNTLYQNRYLITGIGNIIDLKEKKVVFDGRAALVRCSNDSAVFYTNDIFKGKFYSVYDFKTGQYTEVKDLIFKAKLGQDLEFDKTAAPFKLCYYPQGKPKVVLSEDAGYGQQGTTDSHTPDPPLYWLDNDNFVYAHFNKDNTELSVYKMSVSSTTKKLVGKTLIARDQQPAAISRVDANSLLFSMGTQQVLIDLKAETVANLDFTAPHHGFSFECKAAGAAGRGIKLNGKELGKFQFRPVNFKADSNIAALVKEISVGPENYQQGLAVWNANSKSWANIEAEEVLVLAGWIND